MLTEKIILLSKKIEKFDRSTTFLNKTLIGITILLVAMAFIQILLPVIFSEFSWKWKFILVGITIIVLVFLFHYIKKHYLYNPDKI